MSTVQTQLLTAEQFYDWANRPENRGRVCELERGVIVEMSRPGKRHGMVCANVTRILGNYVAQRKKGYVCSNDTGVIVERNPDTVRGPDVLLFEDAESAEQVEEGYGKTPPLLAVEVLSPNDTYGKVSARIEQQLRFGAKQVWVLDPDPGTLVVHSPDRPARSVWDTQEIADELLPGFRCLVAEFFNLPGQ